MARWVDSAGRRLATTLAALAALVVGCGGSEEMTAPAGAFQAVVSSSVPLAIAPRVAASIDGSTWLAWVEGDSTRQSLTAARVDGAGAVNRSTVAASVVATLRDLRITMVGATPVVAWREYDAPDDVKLNAASFAGGSWRMELAQAASGQGDVQAARLATGELGLSWVRVDPTGRFQLVAALRAPSGAWATPMVIRTGAAGRVLLRSSVAADESGSLMAIWTEAPDASGSTTPPPQTLLSSLYQASSGFWGSPLPVDAGELYDFPAIAATAGDSWVAAWLSGGPATRTAVLAKRFQAGAWSAAAERIDRGQDDELRELALVNTGNRRVQAAWTGLVSSLGSGSVRAAAFDTAAGGWTEPALLGTTPRGFPDGLRLQGDGANTAAAVWGVSQGDGGPFLASTDSSGAWQAALQLDAEGSGLAPDLSFFSASDIVSTWFRVAPALRADIVVRRLR